MLKIPGKLPSRAQSTVVLKNIIYIYIYRKDVYMHKRHTSTYIYIYIYCSVAILARTQRAPRCSHANTALGGCTDPAVAAAATATATPAAVPHTAEVRSAAVGSACQQKAAQVFSGQAAAGHQGQGACTAEVSASVALAGDGLRGCRHVERQGSAVALAGG